MKNRIRVIASLAVVAMVFPICACRKKSLTMTEVRQVKADDPYFEAVVTELTMPVDPDLIFDSLDFTSVEIVGDQVLASYYLNYELPSGEEAQLLTSADLDKYFRHGIARFDISGNYLGDFPFNEPNRDVTAITETPDGDICVLSSLYTNYGTYISATTVDSTGEKLDEVSLQMPNTGMDPCFSYLQILPDGNIAVSEGNGFHIFGQDGKQISMVIDRGRRVHPEIYYLNDKYYVLSYLINLEENSVLLKEVNIETGELSEGTDASILLQTNFPEMAKDGAYVTHGNGISKFNLEDSKLSGVFDWNQTDLPRTLVENARYFPQSENEIYAVSWRDKTEKDQAWLRSCYVIRLTRAQTNPHAGKTILVAGGIELSDSFYEYVYRYNSDTSSSARIEVRDYTALYAMDEEKSKKTSAEEALTLDILSGKGPDILVDISGNERFFTENIMVDLNPYISGKTGDAALDRSGYFDSIFRAEEMNGKLYAMPVSFSLSGLLVNTDQVSLDGGLSYSSFLEKAKASPEDVQFLQSTLQSTLLSDLLSASLSSIVDEAGHRASFNGEDFRTILEIAKTCGMQQIPSSERDLTSFSSARDKFQSEICSILRADIHSLEDYCLFMSLLPGKTTLCGYPGDSSDGLLISCEMRLGITSTCGQKDAAWNAIRACLSKEQQIGICEGGPFPVHREAFREVLGKEIEINDRIQAKIERTNAQVGPMLPMGDADIDALASLVDASSQIRRTDGSILEIVLEEAAGYFAGDRDAEEVCSVIQNRVETILKERG